MSGVLLGPADASNFRIKVGRFGTRFYTDPLPACDIAPASDWSGPSMTTTKPPFANRYYTMRGIADMADAEWHRLAGLDAGQRYEAIKAHDKNIGRINMGRGTVIHRWAEERLLGQTSLATDPVDVAEAAEPYRPALEAFFDAYQPELVAAEIVCIDRDLNGVGYGGTCDAIVRIDGKCYIIDWKSRGSDHAAYAEEAAQIAGYARADYMIVGANGGAERSRLPALDGGLIVSIRPDGFKVYPVDLDAGGELFVDMHAWWAAQHRFAGIGKPWAPRAATPTPAEAIAEFDTTPHEGGTIDNGAYTALQGAYNGLDAAGREWFKRVTVEAQRNGTPIHLKDNATERRAAIVGALVKVADTDLEGADEWVRAAVATVLDTDAAHHPSVSLGACVGALTAAEAQQFADLVDDVIAARATAETTEAGHLRFVRAA